MKKNAILSYATNIKPVEFSRFVVSIRKVMRAEHVDVVIFTNATSPEITGLAAQLDIRLVSATSIWGDVQSSTFFRVLFRLVFEAIEWCDKLRPADSRRQRIHDTLTAIWTHPITARHFAYIQFFEQNPGYNLVMLSDARDVVFQADPFVDLAPGRIHAFLQDESLTYGKHNVDTDWYRGIYGAEALAAVQGRAIACAGTVFGDVASLMTLERMLFAEIVRLKRGVVDQAVLNKLLNDAARPFDVQWHANLESNVLTFGEVPDDKFEIGDSAVYVRSRLPAVLHQFDRVPAVDSMIARTV